MSKIDLDPKFLEKVKDPYQRLNNLYWIKDKYSKKIKFKFKKVQEYLYWNGWWNDVVLKSRRHGVSTYYGLRGLDQAIFNPGQNFGIIDFKDDQAVKKLANVRFALECLGEGDDEWAILGQFLKQAILEGKSGLKDNDHTIELANGSACMAGQDFRGDTFQILHISELGPLSFEFPLRAKKVIVGSMETIAKGNKIWVESTHVGGKYGEFYNICKAARSRDGEISMADFKFHFFSWDMDSDNTLDPPSDFEISDRHLEYFDNLSKTTSTEYTINQKYWYIKKEERLNEEMKREHPSTPDEVYGAVIRGSIYGPALLQLEKNRRIVDFVHDLNAPMFTSWDLGDKDYTCIWLIQSVGNEFWLLDYYASKNKGAKQYYDIIGQWERKYGLISKNYLPHDAVNRKAGVSWKSMLEESGLRDIEIVPRTPDVWLGIRQVRNLMPRFRIHFTNCDKEFKVDDDIIPSGLSCLRGYHTAEESKSGIVKNHPVHDKASHGCDALRTFGEAHMNHSLPLSSNKPMPVERTRSLPSNAVTEPGQSVDNNKDFFEEYFKGEIPRKIKQEPWD